MKLMQFIAIPVRGQINKWNLFYLLLINGLKSWKEKAPSGEPPSLMVQIQTAPDLTTLDALEIDVAARDPQIQPKLMGYVRKRRYELENPTPTQQESTLIIY